MATKKSKRFVLVTTDKDRRGVFSGFLEKWDSDKKIAILSDARMAVYWSVETKGVLGLASIGPQKGSRITPKIPSIEIDGVTSISDCTGESKNQWEKEIWN